MKSEWKDISTYSKSDKVRAPKTFQRICGPFRLIVTRNIHYPDDAWVVLCDGVLAERQLASKVLEEAQCQATALLQMYLQTAIDAIVGDEQEG